MSASIKRGLFRTLPTCFVIMTILAFLLLSFSSLFTNTSKAVGGDGASSNIQLLDTNANGKIDRITFDIANPNTETWVLAGSSPYGLSVTQSGNDITISSVSLTTSATANPVGIQIDLSEADGDLLVNTDGVSTGAMELVYSQETGDQTCSTACLNDSTDEELNTIATGDSDGTDTEVDAAKPIVLDAVTQDTDDNGKLDHLELEFSEAIDDSAINAYNASTDYTPSTLALAVVSGEAIEATEGTCDNDAAEDDQYLCISFTEDANTCNLSDQTGCDTDEVDQDVTWTGASVTIQDLSTSPNTVDDLGSGDVTESDGAAPVAVGAKTQDVGDDGTTYNGKVDHLQVVFSEAIDDSATNGYSAGTDYLPSTLAVANVTGEMVDATEGVCEDDAAEDDEYLCIIFTEDAGTCDIDSLAGCDTGVTDQDITWTGASTTIQDSSTNVTPDVGSGTISEADGAAPWTLGIETLDVGADGSTYNGKIDHLQIFFSESLDDSQINNYSAGTDYLPTSLVVANVTGEMVEATEAICPDDAAEDDDVLCLVITEDAGTCDVTSQAGCDTDAVDQDVTWTGTSATINDSASNNQDLGSGDVTEEDGAGPVAVGAQTQDVGVDGLTSNGKVDHLEIVFSESIEDDQIDNYSAGTDYQPSTLALANVSNESVEATETVCENDAAEDDEYLCIVFDEDAGQCDIDSSAGCDTDAVDQDITWTGASITIEDANQNESPDLGSGDLTEVDGAAAWVLGVETLDVGADGSTYNGKLDHLQIFFSENLDDSAINGYMAGTDYTPSTLAVANVSGEAVDSDESVCTDDGGEDDDVLCIVFTEDVNDCDFDGQIGCDTDAVDQDITWTGTSATINDSAGNNNDLVSGDVTEEDGAGPVAVGAQTLDVGNDGSTSNGKVDHLEVVFSENIDDSTIDNFSAGTDYLPTSLAVANVTGEMVDSDESVCPNDGAEDNDWLCIIFTEDAGTCNASSQAGCDTGVTDQDITWTGASVTIEDSNANESPDLASGGITEGDGAAPFAVQVVTMDVGADGSTVNGKVDHLRITFSEDLDDSSINNYSAGTDYLPSSLAVANVSNEMVDASENVCSGDTAEDDEYLCIIFDEDAGTCDASSQAGCDTDAVDQDITWTGSSVTFRDSNGNTGDDVGSGDLTEIDGAAPFIVGAVTYDIGNDGSTSNGKVDHIEAIFSEAVDDSAIDGYMAGTDYTPTSFALANVTGEAIDAGEGVCPNDSAEDDAYLCFIFTEDAGTCDSSSQAGCDTDAVDQDITWTGASVDIQDAGGNAHIDAVSGTVTESDGAAPVLLARVTKDTDQSDGSNGTENGTMDGILATFSESMDASSVTTSEFSIFENDDTALTEQYSDTTDDDTLFFGCSDCPSGDTEDLLKLQITGGTILDLAGVAFANEGSSSAATDGAAPVLLSTSPADGATDIARSFSPTITFSEPIDEGTFAYTAGVAPGGGYTLAWNGTSTVVTFNHANYASNTTFDIEVDTAEADNDNTGFAASNVPNPFDFTTTSGGGGGGGGGGYTYYCSPISNSFTINSNVAKTNKREVTLNVTQTGASEMIFSEDSNFIGASWEPVATTKTFTLSEAEGIKTIYALFRSSCKTGAKILSSIELDYDAVIEEVPEEQEPLAKSSITTNKSSALANGSEGITVVVTLIDNAGQAMVGKGVVLQTSRSFEDSISPSTAVTNSQGEAVFTVTSRFPGVSTFTATYNGSTVSDTANVQFKGSLDEPAIEIVELSVGDVIKTPDSPAVYYYDGKRHPYPNADVYFSYFSDFSVIKEVPAQQLAGIPLGKNAKLRPGTWLVKIQSDPKVYAISPGGTLHWVTTEAIAKALYGDNWNQKIIDLSVTFFNDYTVGSDINTPVLPNGSIFKYVGQVDTYYVQDGKKRKVTPSGFDVNNFQNKFLQMIESTITYPDGVELNAREESIAGIDC